MHKYRLILSFILLSIFGLGFISAQIPHRCGFKEYKQFRMSQDSTLEQLNNGVLQEIQNYIQTTEYQQSKTENEIVKIPVVVHKIGTNVINAVWNSRVVDQIEILNQDFRKKLGTHGWGTGVDTRIEFCLATQDEFGASTTGIINIPGTFPEWDLDASNLDPNSDRTLKNLSHWPAHKYLNLYVADLAPYVLGWSSFPAVFADDPSIDGVVIDKDNFGNVDASKYNLGRTATHEVGHWLGLEHVWGDVNCGDDFCMDTPTQNNPSANPPGSVYDCPTGKISECIPGTVTTDMIENYMQYTDDFCMNKFTEDQSDRMNGVLRTIRNYHHFSSCTSHCENGIKDANEEGVDCGGIDCNPCPKPKCSNFICDPGELCWTDGRYPYDCGGICPPCDPLPDQPPLCIDCFLRSATLNIYGCLKGAINGKFKKLLLQNVNAGTTGFHYIGGRTQIIVDSDYHDGSTALQHGRIYLSDGFQVIASSDNEVRLETCNLGNVISGFHPLQPNRCSKYTDNPCPSDDNRNNFIINNNTYLNRNLSSTINPIYETSIEKSNFFKLDKAKINIEENSVEIHPNPNNGLFKIAVTGLQKRDVFVYDILGKVVYERQDNNSSNLNVDISSHPKGIYYVKVVNQAGEMKVKKIIYQ